MSYTPFQTIPKWIKISKTYADFATAGVSNTITIHSLPSKGIVHACQVVVGTAFSGGTIASYTISVGSIDGNLVKYATATNVFTGATLAQPFALTGIESMSSSADIQATATSTVGLLNAATAGTVDIYLLISLLQ